MVVFTQKINGVTGSFEWAAMDDNYDFHQEITRSAFADMLHDFERNEKYYTALKVAINKMHNEGKPANVLDIGTGTGLLSIMAAQCGADSIIACEAFTPMADCALKIIESNGYSNKILVIPKRSTDIIVGENGDMKAKQNILVTEVFDTELIGEGAIETFIHAHLHLLEKDCIVIPESATVYAQIIESPFLNQWNKLKDIVYNDSVITKIPPEINDCSGCAALHDIQLSQLPIDSFKFISNPIKVFHFDWSGKTPLIKSECSTHKIKTLIKGKAQMVFMWWELKMDIKGKIVLSCAPWWNHTDTNFKHENPKFTIPWRDHWMQAVYYFPKELSVKVDDEIFFSAFHDEYSLWFNLKNNCNIHENEWQNHPICTCGVHMTFSRNHIAHLNDDLKIKKFLCVIEKYINNDSVCLCLNGSSLLGIIAAKLGAKKIIYLESKVIGKKILDCFIRVNNLSNVVSIISNIEMISSSDRENISLVISDPHFNSAILPWDNFRHGHCILKSGLSNISLKVIPLRCTVWLMCVEFVDLHKIKTPLGVYKGINFKIFDELIKNSRSKCDDEIEPQPLWEYPCICKSSPIKITEICFEFVENSLHTYTGHVICEIDDIFNGFVFWLTWHLDNNSKNDISTGPIIKPELKNIISWDPHTKQAVKILEETKNMYKGDKLTYTFDYNLLDGTVIANADIEMSTQI